MQGIVFNKKEKNSKIEGLRGVSILLVVIFHVFCRYQQIYLNYNIVFIEYWGSFGVMVFLLISCFFLGGPVDNRIPFSLKKYFVKKILRLWPCYAVCITITAILIHLCNLPERMSTWKDYFLNLFFLNGYMGTVYVDGAHWYLTTLISVIIITGIFKKSKIANSYITYLVWILTVVGLRLNGASNIAHLLGGAYIGIASAGISIRKITDIYNKKAPMLNLKIKQYQIKGVRHC